MDRREFFRYYACFFFRDLSIRCWFVVWELFRFLEFVVLVSGLYVVGRLGFCFFSFF